MVMILTKTRENKGADSVTCRTELHTPKMSQGPTLFSCGVMENDRWRDLSRKCPLQLEQPGASIWDCLSDKGEEGPRWPRDTAGTCSVTNLIKDLSLSDAHGNPSAPPSKRQCRSLSFSDEMSGCGTSWRPLGSKVWTPVEKRRCYSGGSVQRYSNGVATMQRSSSFSLPARSNPLCGEQPALPGRPGGQPRKSAAGGHGGDRVDMQRSLSCSHDRFSESGAPSASSTPASTPELGRRAAGLSRSRSQPCVLNDKKVGVKRRRPEEVQEQRPSLDLAKMTQNRQTFNSLTCLSTTAEDGSQRLAGPQPWTTAAPEVMPGRTPACTPVPEPPRARPDNRRASRDDLSCEEEEESAGKEEDRAAWRSGGTGSESLFQLDGEIDIEQIENN
ncbi:protein FAM53B isoform X1 [Corvus hawaiiensis]|uniref:protein FAM53B isoform X1 n=2 Tax=Corvus kubaryi TaxID=68294 RepID=UPI001C059CD3|nr:protein FAM53B isoform X1 [Corvus kubaryi]XP_041875478.1 protein FAM53B isoform X1 [Corvus kubaryi]XP_041875479.1 protein FAM53B isoform X1 [Corvus kubaryi]XP_048167030.1 protein FAM53B isoform X1 [Corvus hawaiiensis]XP_048167031.1 protein FAM53B isoform X1 [Corvus hawaiiensis]XP_048167032.1 protein FAM53B isoform X1 [Corvus hawaiiensis]XP_048167033.1 protein FAM53B isoform X1 [Corvus hawaiiensis]